MEGGKKVLAFLCKQYVSFKPGGSKQPKGLLLGFSLETDEGVKEVVTTHY